MSLPPRRVVETYAAYDVISNTNDLRFRVIAATEQAAKVEALEKIGYTLIEVHCGFQQWSEWQLADADDHDDVEDTIIAIDLDEALDIAFDNLGWILNEPEMSVGGVVGGVGFAGTDN